MQEKISEFASTLGGVSGKGGIPGVGNIRLEMRNFEPKIVRKDLEKYFSQLETLFTKIVTIQIKDVKIRMSLRDYKDWIQYKKEDGNIRIDLSDDELITFLKNEFSKNADYLPIAISIFRDENGKIIFDGAGKNGQAVQYEGAVKLIKAAFNSDEKVVEIPVQ